MNCFLPSTRLIHAYSVLLWSDCQEEPEEEEEAEEEEDEVENDETGQAGGEKKKKKKKPPGRIFGGFSFTSQHKTMCHLPRINGWSVSSFLDQQL